MMRKIIGICFCILFCSFSFLLNVAAEDAQTLGELKQSYQAKLNEKAQNEALSSEAKAEIARKEAALKQAEADIHAARSEMEQAQKDIDASNTRIDELKVNASDVLLYLQQMRGTNAYVEYVTGATTMTDMIMRIAAVEQLSNQIHRTIGDLETEIKRNEELKKELDDKTKKLEAQTVEYKRVISENYDKVDEYDSYALNIDEQIKSLKSLLDTYEDKCAKWAPEKGDNAILTVDCVEPKYDSSGNVIPIGNDGWLKPLNSGVITSEIGSRWGSYHNALDIGGNAEGTPVYAAAAGVVSGMIYKYSCGGNMLYIDVNVNGVAYTTYYYHLLSFNVNLGDVVTQDTIIGYVGGGYQTASIYGGYDNCTTGAHLHFGVAKGYYNGYSISKSNVITPPGFPNTYGWRFYSRYDMY